MRRGDQHALLRMAVGERFFTAQDREITANFAEA